MDSETEADVSHCVGMCLTDSAKEKKQAYVIANVSSDFRSSYVFPNVPNTESCKWLAAQWMDRAGTGFMSLKFRGKLVY